jgi:hypothetical protein
MSLSFLLFLRLPLVFVGVGVVFGFAGGFELGFALGEAQGELAAGAGGGNGEWGRDFGLLSRVRLARVSMEYVCECVCRARMRLDKEVLIQNDGSELRDSSPEERDMPRK